MELCFICFIATNRGLPTEPSNQKVPSGLPVCREIKTRLWPHRGLLFCYPVLNDAGQAFMYTTCLVSKNSSLK